MKTIIRAETIVSPSKPPRLIEHAKEDPIRVIQEIFRCAFLDDLRDDLLPKWMRTALINENSIYANADHRSQLFDFFDHLLLLTEALQVISEQHKSNLPEESDQSKQPVLLTDDQVNNPMQIVKDFKNRFQIEYTRRELWHFLEAGVSLAGNYPKGFAPGFALMCYDFMSCLTEAAYCLSED